MPPLLRKTVAFSACAQRHCGIIRFGQTNSGAFVERLHKAFRRAVALTILFAMLKQSGKNICREASKHSVQRPPPTARFTLSVTSAQLPDIGSFARSFSLAALTRVSD